MLLSKELLDKPFFSMTGSEIVELFSTVFPQQQVTETSDLTTKKYVYGISGLAKLLNCGRTKAGEIKTLELLIQLLFRMEKIDNRCR